MKKRRGRKMKRREKNERGKDNGDEMEERKRV